MLRYVLHCVFVTERQYRKQACASTYTSIGQQYCPFEVCTESLQQLEITTQGLLVRATPDRLVSERVM